MTLVGKLNKDFAKGGLAYDWTRSTLYALDHNSGNLLTVDTGTGAATLVGNTGLSAKLWGLVYHPGEDKLFAAAEPKAFYEIDRNTGNAVKVDDFFDPIRG